MKKQILILTLFVAAILVGNNAFGQALDQGITATQPITALTCIASSEPLHPFPGVPYTYTMDGSSGEETVDNWVWFATKDPSFITTDGTGVTTLNTAGALTEASGDLLSTGGLGGGVNYASTTAGANSIEITWSPEILANTVYQGAAGEPTFVVGYGTGECADNIQVYEINPKFNFTIDIANIDPATGTLGWDTPWESCVDVVRSAVYNTTTYELDMDYGTNELYFEVAAANFVNDWTPTFRLLGGLLDVQTATVTLHASLLDAQNDANVLGTHSWAATDIGAAGQDWATGIQFTANDPAEVVTGVSLFVKVVITNSTYESLTSNPFILAVDAQDDNETGLWDMEEEDCTNDPTLDAPDQVDQATHTILPRPQIDHATPDAGAPNPTTTIPKPSTSTAPNF